MSDRDSAAESAARMVVLVLASQKGGSGKTTLSGHLAVEADRAGVGPVALIDTDPQGRSAAVVERLRDRRHRISRKSAFWN